MVTNAHEELANSEGARRSEGFLDIFTLGRHTLLVLNVRDSVVRMAEDHAWTLSLRAFAMFGVAALDGLIVTATIGIEIPATVLEEISDAMPGERIG